jgi:Heterokaryon incompatibility protein (HET)
MVLEFTQITLFRGHASVVNEHIRIIILHPSEDPSSPLTCSIQQLKLGDSVKDYECISYAWGEPTFSHRLDCDDGSIFEITPSLHSALKRFRTKQRSRHLWADAVCIYTFRQQDSCRCFWRHRPPKTAVYRNFS